MTKNDPKVLEIAYSAVKMQRIGADLRGLWGKDPEIREMYVEIERILQESLIDARKAREIASRGGEKPKS